MTSEIWKILKSDSVYAVCFISVMVGRLYIVLASTFILLRLVDLADHNLLPSEDAAKNLIKYYNIVSMLS